MFLKGGCGALLGWLLSEKSQHVPCPYALYLGRFIVAHGSELWSALPALSCQFSVCWLFLRKKPKAQWKINLAIPNDFPEGIKALQAGSILLLSSFSLSKIRTPPWVRRILRVTAMKEIHRHLTLSHTQGSGEQTAFYCHFLDSIYLLVFRSTRGL